MCVVLDAVRCNVMIVFDVFDVLNFFSRVIFLWCKTVYPTGYRNV